MTAAAVAATESPRFMTRRQAAAIDAGMHGNGRAAAQDYARQSARVWARLRSLEALVGDQAPAVLVENERHPGAAAAYATDLARVGALLGDAIRILGKGAHRAG